MSGGYLSGGYLSGVFVLESYKVPLKQKKLEQQLCRLTFCFRLF